MLQSMGLQRVRLIDCTKLNFIIVTILTTDSVETFKILVKPTHNDVK